MGYDWGMSWWGVFGMLFMVVFWVFIIAGAIWLALTLARPRGERGSGGGGSSALGILEDRLARGEIDVEEFRTRKAALEEQRR